MVIKSQNISNDLILIRKVRSDDAKQYIELINSVWRVAYKNIFPEEVFIEIEREKENRIKSFVDKVHNDNKNLCYVAECNGIIVGAIYGTIKSTYEHFLEADFADLVSLYIEPKCQGKGIGTELLKYTKKFGKENNCTDLYLTVNKENANAIKVYEEFGFKVKSIAYSMQI